MLKGNRNTLIRVQRNATRVKRSNGRHTRIKVSPTTPNVVIVVVVSIIKQIMVIMDGTK